MLQTRRAAALIILLAAAPVTAAAQSTTQSTLAFDGDKPIQIESDRLEVREQDKIAIFSGNVAVLQGETELKTTKMTVHYKGSPSGGGGGTTGTSGIERIEADGKVYVRSKEQVATRDRGTFDMVSEIMTMTGKEVVLTEAGNVVVGCKLTIQMKTGQAQLDGCGQKGSGRVKALFQPGSQSQ